MGISLGANADKRRRFKDATGNLESWLSILEGKPDNPSLMDSLLELATDESLLVEGNPQAIQASMKEIQRLFHFLEIEGKYADKLASKLKEDYQYASRISAQTAQYSDIVEMLCSGIPDEVYGDNYADVGKAIQAGPPLEYEEFDAHTKKIAEAQARLKIARQFLDGNEILVAYIGTSAIGRKFLSQGELESVLKAYGKEQRDLTGTENLLENYDPIETHIRVDGQKAPIKTVVVDKMDLIPASLYSKLRQTLDPAEEKLKSDYSGLNSTYHVPDVFAKYVTDIKSKMGGVVVAYIKSGNQSDEPVAEFSGLVDQAEELYGELNEHLKQRVPDAYTAYESIRGDVLALQTEANEAIAGIKSEYAAIINKAPTVFEGRYGVTNQENVDEARGVIAEADTLVRKHSWLKNTPTGSKHENLKKTIRPYL